MNNELHELAYGSYEPCQRCGMSELTTPGWDCVCALLIDMGNCPQCMCIPDRCTCPLRMHRQCANTDESEISSLAISFADAGDDAPSLFDTVESDVYVAQRYVTHRYRTVLQRVDESVAYTPALSSVASQPTYGGIPGENGVPPLTAQERAGLWRGLPSPRFRM